MSQTKILIHNAHIYAPGRDWNPGWLVIDGSRISLMGSGKLPTFAAGTFTETINAGGKILLPGFIDLHTHGAMGHEAMDASEEGLREMARFFAKHGVTAFLPTTWTAQGNVLQKVVETLVKMIGPLPDGATILGTHLEGPYINPVRCGAQDPKLIHSAEKNEAMKLIESGIVRLIALAPEFPENDWLIEECIKRGITVSVGHSAANYEQVKHGVEMGITHSTHTFNAMTALGHREPGTVGGAIAFPEIYCELICDNIHVHPVAQKILIDAKGPQGVILVTDSIRGTGLPEGDYPIDDRTITIKDGIAKLPDGTIAGSILTMERALKNVLAASKRDLSEIWPMSSLNAARNIGLSATKGSLEVGKDADIVLLDSDFNVSLTIAEGHIVYRA